MKQIPLSEVKQGMVLGRAVEDTLGRIILKSGDQIQEHFLPLLRKRGVRHLFVLDEVAQESHSVDHGVSDVIRLTEEEMAAIDVALLRRFRLCEGVATMELLKRMARKHLYQRAQFAKTAAD